jgi:NADH-quinone oxidoreductase subunit E
LQAVVEIAELLELAPAQVQDTLTFYGYFKQDKPHGRCRLWVCRSISCALRGADDLLDHLSHALHVQPGETTPDGRLTLEYAECLGACEHAPCMLANNELLKNQTPLAIDHFLVSVCSQPTEAHL